MASDHDRWSEEYRFQRADQSYGFVYDRRVIIRGVSGRATRVIGAMQDVSSRKISEVRAADAERLAQIGNFTHDRISGKREWSAEMYRLFDLPIGSNVTDEQVFARIHPDDRERVMKAIGPPDPLPEFEYRVVNGEGEVRVVQARVALERLEDGTLARIFGTAQDVTARVDAERTIRDLSRVNELILNNAAEGIVAIGRSGELVLANPAAERMLGWENGTAIPDVHRALHPRERSRDRCSLADDIRAAATRSADGQFFTTGGTPVDVRYTLGAIVEDGRHTGVVLTFADISGSKRLERQLEQAHRVMSLGRIVATIAHEFNNVLMGIQPFAEIIRNRTAEGPIQQAAGQILTSVNRGRRVTHDILRTTQVPEPEIASVDICAWISHLEPELTALAAPNVTLRLERPESPLPAAVDSAQMQQVLTNLVANARDAMPAGGELSLRVDSVRYGPKSMVRIKVTDPGTGIPENVLPLIFEPLFTTKRTGTGLGLSVVQQLVVRNGGSIEVSSEEGKGTTFTILLPTADAVAPEDSSGRPAGLPVRRLLLVEDDESVAEGLAAVLELEGIGVRVVNRGRDALSAAAEFEPDAAIIDVGLPDISGGDLYDQLVGRWPDLPVVFSTGQGDAAHLARQLANPSVRLLRKPYDIASLLDALREIA
jgi:PAS domain S-box-containing protein